MIQPKLLEILVCPACIHEGKEGKLDYYRESWLVCHDCGRKYPITADLNIPVMLIEEGDKWVSTPVEDLPVPPPPIH